MKKTVKFILSMLLVCMFMFNLGGGVIAEELSRQVYHQDLSDPNEVCEGLFFLRSVASTNTSQYYLTDFDYFTTTGVSFSDIQSQQWRLVDAGNGYYKIISTQTGFYLTAREDGNEGAVGLTRNPTDNPDRQLWKFIETWNSGTDISYRIVPKAYENTMCLGLSDTMGMYGRVGEQKSYSADDIPNDFNEWRLVNYKTEVSLFYDGALETKFIDAIEKGDFYKDVETTLLDLTDDLNEVYIKVFGLKFSVAELDSVETTTDRCKIANNYELTDKVKCPAHPIVMGNCEIYNQGKLLDSECKNCTSSKQLFRDFISEYDGTINNVSVLFTGHTLYDDSGDRSNRSFKGSGTYGICIQQWHSPYTYHLVTIRPFVHEIAHHIGAPDHYHEIINDNGVERCRGGDLCIHEDCNPTSGRPGWCIMATREFTAEGLENADYDEIFCDGCINDIKNYLRTYILD